MIRNVILFYHKWLCEMLLVYGDYIVDVQVGDSLVVDVLALYCIHGGDSVLVVFNLCSLVVPVVCYCWSIFWFLITSAFYCCTNFFCCVLLKVLCVVYHCKYTVLYIAEHLVCTLLLLNLQVVFVERAACFVKIIIVVIVVEPVGYCCDWLMILVVIIGCCCYWLLLLLVVVVIGRWCCYWLLLLLLLLLLVVIVVIGCYWLLLVVIGCYCCYWLLLVVIVVIGC
jgi:hypothetical protein